MGVGLGLGVWWHNMFIVSEQLWRIQLGNHKRWGELAVVPKAAPSRNLFILDHMHPS